eukprot:15454037-Alexandrium_andersonii.AAC.1
MFAAARSSPAAKSARPGLPAPEVGYEGPCATRGSGRGSAEGRGRAAPLRTAADVHDGIRQPKTANDGIMP